MPHLNDPRRTLRLARRVVVKAGTPVVSHCDNKIALGRIGNLVEQISAMRAQGMDVILVSSGAIGTGTHRMQKAMILQKPMGDVVDVGADNSEDVNLPAAAAVGQSILMSMWESLFGQYNISCAQLLITEQDVNEPTSLNGICETAAELLGIGTIPIVNDNDALTDRQEPVWDAETAEVHWDNDVLAAKIASEMNADLLILLTDMDSLYCKAVADPIAPPGSLTAPPPTRLSIYSPEAELVRAGIIFDAKTSPLLSNQARGAFAGRTRMSAQGMRNVVDAALLATAGGRVRAAVVTTGHHPLALVRVIAGEDVGTLFLPEAPAARARL